MSKKPNIVFVFSDQHRRHSMSIWQKEEYKPYLVGEGDPVHTPNIDRLCEEGILISDAYSSYPVCSPFRAMLFSGRYPSQNGVWENCRPGMDDCIRGDIPTFCDILSQDGYSVGYVGKWHLEKPNPDFDKDGNYIGNVENFSGERFYPNGAKADTVNCWDTLITKDRQRSIDYLRVYNTWDIFRSDYEENPLRRPHYWDKEYNRTICPKGVWSPEFETQMAIDFLENKHGERDADKPFSLFLSYNPPHLPYNSRRDTDYESYDKYYSKEVLPDAKTLVKRENVEKDDEKFYENIRVHFSHICGIDRCFGKLLDYIDSSDEKDNTIVVFCSDHGEMMGSHGLMSKNVPYEEATAIPFVIRYNDKLKHRVEPLFLTAVDIMPTLLGLCGEEVPDYLEGKDYSSLLISGEGKRPESALYLFPVRKGVRTKKYMLNYSDECDDEFERTTLFDMEKDPYQLHNLPLDSIPKEDLLFLRKELGRLLRESNDPWYRERLHSDFIIYD